MDIMTYITIEKKFPSFLSEQAKIKSEQRFDNFKYVCEITSNVDSIFLKGFSLNYQILPNVWNRYSHDIDILVSEDSLDQLSHILLSSQFKYTGGKYTSYLDDSYIRLEENHHIHPFVKIRNGQELIVEPHRYPFSKRKIDYGIDYYSFNFDEMFKTAKFLDIDGCSVHVLECNFQFVQLIMHFTTHILAEIRAYIFRIRNFSFPFEVLHTCTLFYLTQKDKLSYQKILDISKEWGVTYDVKYALSAIKEVYDIESDLIDQLLSTLDENENPNRMGYRSFRILFYLLSQSKHIFFERDILHMLQEKNYVSHQPD